MTRDDIEKIIKDYYVIPEDTRGRLAEAIHNQHTQELIKNLIEVKDEIHVKDGVDKGALRATGIAFVVTVVHGIIDDKIKKMNLPPKGYLSADYISKELLG